MTQQDGPTQPDGPPDAANQRERRWPPVADVDWWREGTSEYIPVRRPPAEPPRDTEIDFDLDEPGAPPRVASVPTATAELVETEIVESGPPAGGVVDAELVDDVDLVHDGELVDDAQVVDGVEPVDDVVDVDGRSTPAVGPWAAGSRAASRPVDRAVDKAVDKAGDPVDAPVDAAVDISVTAAWATGADPAPVDRPVDNPVDRAVDKPWADTPGAETPGAEPDETVDGATESTGIGRSDSPYARPPRVTRREFAPAPRRVLPIPPAIIIAPPPATAPESPGGNDPFGGGPPRQGTPDAEMFDVDTFDTKTFDTKTFDTATFDTETTTVLQPPERSGLSLFDSTGVGAIPALPRPRRQPASPAPARAPRRARRARRNRPRRPAIGLPALVILLFAAAFIAWVSAEPFWLDAGHGTTGTATVVARTDRCQVTFAASGGGFTTSTVDLAGADLGRCEIGTTIPAQMVSADAARAYVVDQTGLRLRWAVGLGGVLLCGWGIVWATGAARFRSWLRLVAIAISLGAPLVIAATMLALTY